MKGTPSLVRPASRFCGLTCIQSRPRQGSVESQSTLSHSRYRLLLQMPKGLNGRSGHGCFESTLTSIDCLEVPGAVPSADPLRCGMPAIDGHIPGRKQLA